MPFKPGKSPQDAARRINTKLNNIANKKVQRGLTKVLYLLGGRADQYAPVDTKALINSRFIKIESTATGGKFRGIIGYAQPYAVPLHNPKPGGKMDNWKPVKPPAPGKPTGGYNAEAKQGWIQLGLDEIWPEKVKQVFMKELTK